jgi:hypothetical protein
MRREENKSSGNNESLFFQEKRNESLLTEVQELFLNICFLVLIALLVQTKDQRTSIRADSVLQAYGRVEGNRVRQTRATRWTFLLSLGLKKEEELFCQRFRNNSSLTTASSFFFRTGMPPPFCYCRVRDSCRGPSPGAGVPSAFASCGAPHGRRPASTRRITRRDGRTGALPATPQCVWSKPFA